MATVLVTCSGSSWFSQYPCFENLCKFLHLSGAMPARLTTRTLWGLLWTFLGFRCWQGFRHLWRVSNDTSMSFLVFPLFSSQRTFIVSWAIDSNIFCPKTKIYCLLAGPISVSASSCNIMLPPLAIDMASSALQIAGISFLLWRISFST